MSTHIYFLNQKMKPIKIIKRPIPKNKIHAYQGKNSD